MKALECRPCHGCDASFKPKNGRIKFCSHACYVNSRRGVQGPGNFPAGIRAHNWLPVGSEQVRQRKNRDEHARMFVKVAEPNVWKLRAVIVWESVNGKVPRGSVVHHVNRDALDDRLENLLLLSRAAHLAEHRDDHSEVKRSASMRLAWERRRQRAPKRAPCPLGTAA